MQKSLYLTAVSSVALLAFGLGTPAFAKEAADQVTPPQQTAAENDQDGGADEEDYSNEIVVTADRMTGSVDTNIKPVDVLDEGQIAAYGATSVDDLLTALAPQIGNGRGRGGGGRPIMLVNGRPVNDFREIMSLPPEAIVRVEIFPEELALKYGYRPDQRVVNLILKPDYASAEIEYEYGFPTQGDRQKHEFDVGFTRIGPSSRLNINLEYNTQDNITEADRDVVREVGDASVTGFITAPAGGEIDPILSSAAGGTVTVAGLPGGSTLTVPALAAGAGGYGTGSGTAFRDLVGSEDNFEATASFSKQLGPLSDFSLSASLSQADETRLLGLQSVNVLVDGDNAANPLNNDVRVTRLLPSDQGLLRTNATTTMGASTGVNGRTGDWSWRTSVSATKVKRITTTQIGIDPAAFQAGVNDGSINPFGDSPAAGLFYRNPNRAITDTFTVESKSTVNGILLDLPAGPLQVTLDAQGKYNEIKSDQSSFGTSSSTDLSRKRFGLSGNVEVPLFEDGVGIGETLGSLSLNGNAGYSDVSDFGGLVTYGGGLNWGPFDNLGVSFSYITEEEAPSLTDLGNPQLLTPNVSVYDFTRGETALVDYISGGNPNLAKEQRRDIKVTVNWQPIFVKDLRITGEYLRNRSSNVTAQFPSLTPAIEGAFPGRVTRDADGRIIRVDARPVTFAETRSDALKLSLSYSGGFGEMQQQQMPGMGAGRPGVGGPRAGGGGGRPGGGGGRGGGMGGPGGGQAGRFFISLGYQYQLQDQIDIGLGVPTLDLLNGDATGTGGTPRHRANLEGGVFYKGMGLRLSGRYTGGSQVDGDPLTGSTGLEFGDLATFDVRVFINLEQRGNLAQKIPFFKGTRVSFAVDNVFDSYQRVTDDSGQTPIGFQRAYIDPVGRFFEVDFRKRF